MRLEDLKTLVNGTLDAAYAVDAEGQIVAWNDGAEKLFGVAAAGAIASSCYRVVQGVDEGGPVCSLNCTVRQSLKQGTKLSSFDMQVQTPEGRRWCSASVFVAYTSNCSAPHALHIMRGIDVPKRMELAMRDYLVAHTMMSAEEGTKMLASTTAAHQTNLSERELEVLRMLASGGSTTSIASELHVSGTTVSNHIQHILLKLDCHSRLQAIRRAERAGLV